MCEGSIAVLVLAVALLPFVLRRLALRGPALAPVLLLACCLFLIHWRQGIQLDGTFGEYTPELPARPDLLARSPAIDFLHADHAGPFRGVGLGANLMLGYNAIAGVESFNSPETFVSPYLAELKTAGMKFTRDWLTDSLDKTRLAAVKRFYDLCNVRYYLTLPDDTLASVPGLRLIGKLDLDVYRNETAWPRAFFVDRLQDYDGVQDYVRAVKEGDAHPFAAVDRKEYLLDPRLAGRFAKTPAGRAVVPASHYQLAQNATSFDIDAPRAGRGRPERVFLSRHDLRLPRRASDAGLPRQPRLSRRPGGPARTLPRVVRVPAPAFCPWRWSGPRWGGSCSVRPGGGFSRGGRKRSPPVRWRRSTVPQSCRNPSSL